MPIYRWCQWLEGTPVGTWVREAPWAFQIMAAVHILGLVFSVGIVLWFDLRLLGVSLQGSRVSAVYRALMPWALGGFAVMFVSGAVIFAGFATGAYASSYFRLKLAAMVLAGVNAGVYHLVTERQIARWDTHARPPAAAHRAGLVSILLWTLVVIAGRMMSYTMF